MSFERGKRQGHHGIARLSVVKTNEARSKAYCTSAPASTAGVVLELEPRSMKVTGQLTRERAIQFQEPPMAPMIVYAGGNKPKPRKPRTIAQGQ